MRSSYIELHPGLRIFCQCDHAWHSKELSTERGLGMIFHWLIHSLVDHNEKNNYIENVLAVLFISSEPNGSYGPAFSFLPQPEWFSCMRAWDLGSRQHSFKTIMFF